MWWLITTRNMINKIKKKTAQIKLLALDFDGIMTNGKVRVDQNGIESVECSRKDGLGIAFLKKHGTGVCIISKETNPVVTARCKNLEIPCMQAVKDSDGKAEILKRLIQKKGLAKEEVAFLGDDLNDIGALKSAGLAVTVS